VEAPCNGVVPGLTSATVLRDLKWSCFHAKP
jgi:hypothetical protein